MRQYKLGDFLLCKWKDACSFDDWVDNKDSDTPPPIVHSVGILALQKEDYIILALNKDTANEKMSCLMTIPTGMIVSLRKLK